MTDEGHPGPSVRARTQDASSRLPATASTTGTYARRDCFSGCPRDAPPIWRGPFGFRSFHWTTALRGPRDDLINTDLADFTAACRARPGQGLDDDSSERERSPEQSHAPRGQKTCRHPRPRRSVAARARRRRVHPLPHRCGARKRRRPSLPPSVALPHRQRRGNAAGVPARNAAVASRASAHEAS